MLSFSAAVRRMDCSATRGFLRNIRRKGFSVFEPALIAGVFEEKASSSHVCFEACAYWCD